MKENIINNIEATMLQLNKMLWVWDHSEIYRDHE